MTKPRVLGQTSSLTTRELSASQRPASDGLTPLTPSPFPSLCATLSVLIYPSRSLPLFLFLCPSVPVSLYPSTSLSFFSILPPSLLFPSRFSHHFFIPPALPPPLPPTTSCPLGASLPVWVRGELVHHVALCEGLSSPTVREKAWGVGVINNPPTHT